MNWGFDLASLGVITLLLVSNDVFEGMVERYHWQVIVKVIFWLCSCWFAWNGIEEAYGLIAMFSYLMSAAWIDYHSLRVYRCQNIIYSLAGLWWLLVRTEWTTSLAVQCLYLLLLAVICMGFVKMHWIGSGDGKALWVMGVYNLIILGIPHGIQMEIQAYVCSGIVFLLYYLPKIQLHRFRLSQAMPMVPALLCGNGIAFIVELCKH